MSFLKSMWKASSKHKKLSEELALQSCKEPEEIDIENDVVTFKLKYLGSTVIEKIIGENVSAETVKSILKTVKQSRKKIARVNLNISLKGICVTDLQGNDIFKVSIYRISNCSTDASHRQIFSFISTDQTETTECHAFFCNKRKTAETVTLAVAHAFSTAYEAWRILPTTKQFARSAVEVENGINANKESFASDNSSSRNILPAESEHLIDNSKHVWLDDVDIKESVNNMNSKMNERNMLENNIMDQLINLEDEQVYRTEESGNSSFANQWVCFEDDFSSISNRNDYKEVDLILA